jgi:recombination protein RecA
MSDAKRRRLETTIASVQQRHGAQALHRGDDMAQQPLIPHIPTGFGDLDAITGCQGIPLGAITLLSGRTTSGKLTVAYKLLANAQRDYYGRTAHTVALLDLSRTADPDYIARCGVDLDALLVGRPQPGPEAIYLLGDLLRTQQLRAVVVDSLADLAADRDSLTALHAALGKLQQRLRATGAALVVLDDPRPPWLRWFNLDSSSKVRWCAALHIEMQRERWLRQGGSMVGYRSQARLLKSRWVYGIRSATVEIVFNGTVRAQETW